MPKTNPIGSILSNKDRGYIFSFGGKMHGGWKKTPKEAKAVQKAFLEAKGWGDTFAGRPVKLISEKP